MTDREMQAEITRLTSALATRDIELRNMTQSFENTLNELNRVSQQLRHINSRRSDEQALLRQQVEMLENQLKELRAYSLQFPPQQDVMSKVHALHQQGWTAGPSSQNRGNRIPW